MRIALYVALGSGLGGTARVAMAAIMVSLFGANFPIGVLTVNVLGSFAIGFIAAFTAPGGWLFLGAAARQFLLAGFCGGFTTFSFFSLQTMQLLQDGRLTAAGLYSALTLSFSMFGVWIGYRIGFRRIPAAHNRARDQ
jgi:fluoride exporter